MAYAVGTVTLTSGTGVKTITGLPFTPTWIRWHIGGLSGDTYVRSSDGFGTTANQYALSQSPSKVSQPLVGKLFEWQNNAGAVLFDGSLSSFPTNQVQINVTTQSGTVPQAIMEIGN